MHTSGDDPMHCMCCLMVDAACHLENSVPEHHPAAMFAPSFSSFERHCFLLSCCHSSTNQIKLLHLHCHASIAAFTCTPPSSFASMNPQVRCLWHHLPSSAASLATTRGLVLGGFLLERIRTTLSLHPLSCHLPPGKVALILNCDDF